MPPGLVLNLIRGFDVIALITLPLLVGWSPLISLAIAAIAYMVLRSGGFNTQELMERNEEAKREMESIRAGQGTGTREKITYTRNQRTLAPLADAWTHPHLQPCPGRARTDPTGCLLALHEIHQHGVMANLSRVLDRTVRLGAG